MKEQIRRPDGFMVVLKYVGGELEEEERRYFNGARPLIILHGVVRRSRAWSSSEIMADVSRIAQKRPFEIVGSTNYERERKERKVEAVA